MGAQSLYHFHGGLLIKIRKRGVAEQGFFFPEYLIKKKRECLENEIEVEFIYREEFVTYLHLKEFVTMQLMSRERNCRSSSSTKSLRLARYLVLILAPPLTSSLQPQLLLS